MKKIIETGMILFAAWGFWGMIYPDLCFVEDVCAVYITEGEEAQVQIDDMTMSPDIFTRLCMAEPEQIRVKSRLMEVLTESKGSSNVVSKR